MVPELVVFTALAKLRWLGQRNLDLQVFQEIKF